MATSQVSQDEMQPTDSLPPASPLISNALWESYFAEQHAQGNSPDPPHAQTQQNLASTLALFEQFDQQNIKQNLASSIETFQQLEQQHAEAQQRISKLQAEIEAVRKSAATERQHVHCRWKDRYFKQIIQTVAMKKEQDIQKRNSKIVQIAEELADGAEETGYVRLFEGLKELQQAVQTRDEGGKGQEHGRAVKEARRKKRVGLKVRLTGVVVKEGKAVVYNA